MDHQFYGLTEAGEIVLLPKAEYSSTAMRLWEKDHEDAGRQAPKLQLILSEETYQVVYSHMMSEVSDLDDDGQVPHYLCISLQTQLPVFPHPSVDTPQEMAEFLENYPTPLTQGVVLREAAQNWPEPQWVEPESV